MEQKKLFKRIIIVTAVVFVLMLTVVISQYPYRETQFQRRTAELKAHLARLVTDYQAFLSSTAQTIKAIPVDAEVISRIQSEIFQKQVDIKLYLWLADTKGDFKFGLPADSFSKLNTMYDKLSGRLPDKDRFISRNEFLLQYVDRHDQIDLSALEFYTVESLDLERPFRDLYDELRDERDSSYYYVKPRTFVLSAPVYGPENALIGNLFLKIDDSANRELYFTKNRMADQDIYAKLEGGIQALTILSGLFLWFLLPTWVYIDGKKRDVKNIGVWVVLTVVASIFGLMIYLVTRPIAEKSFRCPKCDKELNGTKAFCPHCGFDLSSAYCPECNYPIKTGWDYCPSCRSPLQKKDENKP